VRNGKEIPLSDLKLGDKLNATIVTTYPPQVVTKRSVTANLTPAPQPATSSPPTAVASAEPATLPKTGSPLPLLGLLGGIALATALLLRGIDRRRRAG
jgi:LPXTG-motif cell wall-anchored protein